MSSTAIHHCRSSLSTPADRKEQLPQNLQSVGLQAAGEQTAPLNPDPKNNHAIQANPL